MNSFAHYSFGAVYGWMAQTIGGIKIQTSLLGKPRRMVFIEPRLDPNLTWAKTSYRSIIGTIATSWRRDGDRLELEVTIPPNAVPATVWLPAANAGDITEGGRPIAQAEGVSGPLEDSGRLGPGLPFFVGSGTYRFQMRLR